MGIHEPAEQPLQSREPQPRQELEVDRDAWWAALVGMIAVGVAAAAGELVAFLISPSVTPVTAVGSTVIDLMPQPLKEWAIATFGTADKAALLVVMALVISVLAAVAGIAEIRRRYAGAAVIVVFALIGLAAVLATPQAEPLAVVAPVVVGVAGALIITALGNMLRRWNKAELGEGLIARRRFLQVTGAGAVVAVAGVVVSSVLRGVQTGGAQLRAALTLPRPVEPADPIPSDATAGLEGVPPLVTPNSEFYRIDTALVVPQVESDTWRLKVTGMVENEIEVTFEELLAKPLVERYLTLACVSNPVGGDLIGNAKWLGWPIRELLAEARPTAGADMVFSTSVDGWTASTPLEALTDERDSLLAIGMNDEPLPYEHGFPVRIVVPGLYGYVSATKWVTELKLSRFEDELAYWTVRGWTERGPIKTSARIDRPRPSSVVPAGTVLMAGYAWAQNLGIEAVQVQVDGGQWQPAVLGAAISADTWRQWVAPLVLEPGTHELAVRAVDANGNLQTADVAPVMPSGATGYHRITVKAE